jgi:hypothetical protein
VINELSRVEVICEGASRRLVWGAIPGGRFRARDYFHDLPPTDRAKFEPLFRRLAAAGRITNKERFRKEPDDIFCLKSQSRRLACFDHGRDLVLIYGFTKKTERSRRSRRHLATAARLRRSFLDAA